MKKLEVNQKDLKNAIDVLKDLAKNDEKLALRFQNKYRGLIKNNKSLVSSVIEEIKEQEGELYENPKAKAQEMRFGFRVDARHQDSQSKVEEGNLVQQKATTKNGYTPVWSAENMYTR